MWSRNQVMLESARKLESVMRAIDQVPLFTVFCEGESGVQPGEQQESSTKMSWQDRLETRRACVISRGAFSRGCESCRALLWSSIARTNKRFTLY